uniref:Secreted protein n=1 Tax=Oreochromis aureus TaxID=47969 RepID=A0A668VML3_OREAU
MLPVAPTFFFYLTAFNWLVMSHVSPSFYSVFAFSFPESYLRECQSHTHMHTHSVKSMRAHTHTHTHKQGLWCLHHMGSIH